RKELNAAQQGLPNDALAFLLAAYIDRRQGHWEESTRNFEHAAELDPRNLTILQQLSLTYENLRRYADRTAVLDRALRIAPNDVVLRMQRAGVPLSWRADPKPLHTTIQTILAENPNAAETALAAMPPGGCREVDILFPNSWCEALVARTRGDQQAERAAFTKSRAELEKMVRDQPDYADALCSLGVVDAALGNKEDAIREGRRAVELMPVERNAIE